MTPRGLFILTFLNRCIAWGFCESQGTGKRGHIVTGALLLMMFLGLRKLGNIFCGHKMFLNKIRNIFVSRTQNLCPQHKCCARGQTGKHLCRQQCVLVCQRLVPSPSRTSSYMKYFPRVFITSGGTVAGACGHLMERRQGNKLKKCSKNVLLQLLYSISGTNTQESQEFV